MHIHLVTYATRRFRHRQILLSWSAYFNHVTDSFTGWTPHKLIKSEFHQVVQDIKLSERGSGFWSWKPYIIADKLSKIPDGDIVFYCDVGRRYPFKELATPIQPMLDWMKSVQQDVLPGVYIPWQGPMSMWTKRDAFHYTEMDREEYWQAIPIQASFSLWCNTPATRTFVGKWLNLAKQRHLISDDPSQCGLPELPDFVEHRHDQALLTLCCLKEGIRGLSIGENLPAFDTQHPDPVSHAVFHTLKKRTFFGTCLNSVSVLLAFMERCFRPKS